jgi:hypothetical protein
MHFQWPIIPPPPSPFFSLVLVAKPHRRIRRSSIGDSVLGHSGWSSAFGFVAAGVGDGGTVVEIFRSIMLPPSGWVTWLVPDPPDTTEEVMPIGGDLLIQSVCCVSNGVGRGGEGSIRWYDGSFAGATALEALWTQRLWQRQRCGRALTNWRSPVKGDLLILSVRCTESRTAQGMEA